MPIKYYRITGGRLSSPIYCVGYTLEDVKLAFYSEYGSQFAVNFKRILPSNIPPDTDISHAPLDLVDALELMSRDSLYPA